MIILIASEVWFFPYQVDWHMLAYSTTDGKGFSYPLMCRINHLLRDRLHRRADRGDPILALSGTDRLRLPCSISECDCPNPEVRNKNVSSFRGKRGES